MDDARVRRTRERVFAAVRALLADGAAEQLTVSRIAEVAGVARKTVYAHWPSVPAIVADVLLAEHAVPDPVGPGDDVVEAVTAFLRGVREAFTDPAVRAAMAYLIASAPTDDMAAGALRSAAARRSADLARIVGSEHAERLLIELTGPVFFSQFVMQTPASDAVIETMAARVTPGDTGAGGAAR
ncbi:TetR/AcrR family transcriptional regulator [Microbacterium sp. Kw_RZR3]|uniref:TetR/AcrR family transcriptional regulator n=1 Tax=Microbacterium sp. Kw_RZR3 TaxID=3032903 RepID=UPI0023DC43F5|nr:TetR/AcrR family transcriptional regulator [Microbacterium sp. Kw_RZR3]MDF2044904.1 TetR/AcrR family transcriptional regulator [Microbacterium sp. Kw_RZR3]